MISGYIGLARRARLVIAGSDKVLEKIKTKSLNLLLIASNASENTKKRFIDKATFYQINYIVIDYLVLQKVYKENTPKILGITDLGLAEKILAIKGDEVNG